jgi:hypothetical protein
MPHGARRTPKRGEGLGRLLVHPHGLIPVRINVHRWSQLNGCARTSGEQNRCLLRPGANPKSICFSTGRHRASSWVQRPKATAAAAAPPARPLVGACTHPRVSAPPSSGHAAVPSEVPSRSPWATDLVVAPRRRIRSCSSRCQSFLATADPVRQWGKSSMPLT